MGSRAELVCARSWETRQAPVVRVHKGIGKRIVVIGPGYVAQALVPTSGVGLLVAHVVKFELYAGWLEAFEQDGV